MGKRGFKRTELSEEGHLLEGFLRGNAAVAREDGTQHQDIELRLMVTDQHGGPSLKVFLAADDELYTCGVLHGVFEGAGDGPLGEAGVADGAEEEGGDDAVDGAGEEAEVGCEEAAVEAHHWDGGRGYQEDEGEEEVG
jgi:hypothetical protein